MAFNANQNALAEIYMAAFNRVPDQAGFDFWLNLIDNGTHTIAEASTLFFNSDEATAIYGGKTNAELVDTIYMNILGRGASSDTEGSNYWIAKLDNNESTQGDIIETIINAAKANGGDDAARIANKNLVADSYLQNDDKAGVVAPDLSTITEDSATATAAIATIEAQATPGTTVALTDKTDNIIGTAGNDTITGTEATFASGTDLVIDQSTSDNDTLTLDDLTTNVAATIVTNIENVNIDFAVAPGTTPTVAATNFSGVKNLTVSRSDLANGAIEGKGDFTITNLDGSKVEKVTTAEQIVNFNLTQATKAGTTVNADTATGNVMVDGAATISAAATTGTVDVDAIGVTAEDAKAVSITAAKADVINTEAGLTGSITVDAAAASDVDVLGAGGGATVTAATAPTKNSTVTLAGIDETGATVTVGTGVENATASTFTIDVQLGATAGATDKATVNGAGYITLDAGHTTGTVDTLELAGNGAAVEYETSTTNGSLVTVSLTGDQSVTVNGDSDEFSGVAIADNTTAGTTTLKLTGDSAADIDLSKAVVDLIDINVLDLDNTLTVADNANIQVSKDQNTDNLQIDAKAADQTVTISTGDDTVDSAAVTIQGGVVALGAGTNFKNVNLNATIGNFTATSFAATNAAVTITGTKDVTLGNITAKSVDASALTGKLDATMKVVNSLTSGTANDTIVLDNAAVLTLDAGAGNNNITVTSANVGSSITAAAGNDTVNLNDADSVVINLGEGTNTVNVGNFDIDSILVSGSGTSDVLDFAGPQDLSNNTNFAFSGFETVNIADATGNTKISAAQFNGQTLKVVGDSATLDILTIVGDGGTGGTTAVDTIDASTITLDTAKLVIDGGDKADILTASANGTTFLIEDGDVDSGEVITGAAGTDVIDGSALSTAVDLSVATITNIETLYANSQNVTLGQGTGISKVEDDASTADVAASSFVLVKGSTAFGAEVTAANVDAAGEWDITDSGTSAVLTYFDEVTSTVETITFADAGAAVTVTGSVVAGNIVLDIA